MVCSGDAGVYGLAGLICEIGKDYPRVEIEIVRGSQRHPAARRSWERL